MGTFAPALDFSHAAQVRLFWLGAVLLVVAVGVWLIDVVGSRKQTRPQPAPESDPQVPQGSFVIGGPGAKVTRSAITDSYSTNPSGFGGIHGDEVEDAIMEGNVHDPKGDRNIHTEHQSGGTNITGDVHLNAPQASLKAQILTQNEPGEGGYLTRARLQVLAPHAATTLVVAAQGTSIQEIRLGPVGGGINMNARESFTPTLAWKSVGPPVGPDYNVIVRTAQPDDLQIEATLDP